MSNTSSLEITRFTAHDRIEEVVERTLEEGACIVETGVSIADLLQKRLHEHREVAKERRGSLQYDRYATVRTIIAGIAIIEEIEHAVHELTGVGEFNMISHLQYPIGHTNSWHIDTHARLEGFSMLFPRNHLGKFGVYADSDFRVNDWGLSEELVPERRVQRVDPSKPLIPERSGYYQRGQMMLLRQDVLGLPPKVHTATSFKGEPHGNDYARELDILDRKAA